MPAWGYGGAAALQSLVPGRVLAGMAMGSPCCLSQQPPQEGQVKGKKKRCGFKEELHDIWIPVNKSFQKTPASCEMVLLLTWQWPACVQLVQVKVWGHRGGSCFTAVHFWCKK